MGIITLCCQVESGPKLFTSGGIGTAFANSMELDLGFVHRGSTFKSDADVTDVTMTSQKLYHYNNKIDCCKKKRLLHSICYRTIYSLHQFHLTKYSFFVHTNTPCIHLRLDFGIGLGFFDCYRTWGLYLLR